MRIISILTIAIFLLLQTEIKSQNNNIPDSYGIIKSFNFNRVDDLLNLSSETKMIMFNTAEEKAISSAHLEMFKRWIANGGKAYFYKGGWYCSLNKKLNLVQASKLEVRKENGENLNSKVGELIIRDLLPFLKINSHTITQNVNRLYLYGGHFFIGGDHDKDLFQFQQIMNSNFYKIIEIGYKIDDGYVIINPNNTAKDKRLATVFCVVEMQKGLVIYDGTPLIENNAFQNNNYDWPVMYQNILNYSK